MIKRIVGITVSFILVTSQVFAWSGNMQGKWKQSSAFKNEADNYAAQCRAGYGHFPPGLTFYKDFTKITPGTYSTARSNILDADYSIGSPVATVTASDSTVTITSSGYQATTANDEVLKYLIAGNRTAAQETIIIKFTPTGDFANDGVLRHILASETKSRKIRKFNTGSSIEFKPNDTDSGACGVDAGIAILNGISYTITFICSNLSTPYAQILQGATNRGTAETSDNFITPSWGTYFCIGAREDGIQQLDGEIKSICIFNRRISTTESLSMFNIL